MGVLLDLAYAAGVAVASPWLLFKFATDRSWRRGLDERLGAAPRREPGRPCLWLHCASVGEVNLCRPLVKELSARRPELELNVSVTTPAGRDRARKAYPGARLHFYPVDFGFAVGRALRRVKPDAIVLVELEVWPNFIQAAHRRGIPVAVINGRMSRRSYRRYRRLSWIFRGVFRRLTAVGAQDRTCADRLADLGAADRILVTGNLKYDASIDFDPKAAAAEVRARWGISPDARLIVAGSTHDPEERLVLASYATLRRGRPDLRLLIAPRHVERADDVERLIVEAGLPVSRRSRMGGPPADGAVLLLDTVGELSRAYAAADAVFIGGTFCARGGQNMLEPAALGKPVVSGPSLENFQEISSTLERAGGMTVLTQPSELTGALERLLADPNLAAEQGRRGREAVESGRGALMATADLVMSLLSGPRTS